MATTASLRQDSPLDDAPGKAAWRRALARPEGKIFVLGAALLLAYALAVVGLRFRSPRWSHDLLTMSVTHVLTGRAAGISVGYALGLHRWAVMLANFAIEAFMVMLFYPLFVLSYQKLIVIGPLREAMQRAHDAAHQHRKRVVRWGIPGLFLFVLFPFYMTGPVVGCVIGFLIGLGPWVNLSVVLAGTGAAIVGWGVLLERLHARMEALGHYVPMLFVGLIIFLAIALRIRTSFGQARSRRAADAAASAKAARESSRNGDGARGSA